MTGVFCPAGGAALPLSDLQLLNYDAMVTQEVLQPLSRLRSLSIFHLYSVPGPTCHLRTWLTALPQLRSLSVHGQYSSSPVLTCPLLLMLLRCHDALSLSANRRPPSVRLRRRPAVVSAQSDSVR